MRNKFLILLGATMLINTVVRSNDCDRSVDCDAKCSSSNDCTTDCFKNLRTSLHFRSQGANTARELVGWQWELNKPEMCENYGSAYLAFEYQRSFKDKRIAEALFGSSSLKFAGSAVADRLPNELLADNFGLSTTFRGNICFKPRIENYILDLGFSMGLDYWIQGLYVRLHAPFVHSRSTIDINCGNSVTVTEDSTPFPSCYMDASPVDSAATIKQALSGNFLFGQMQTPWCGGKFDFARRTRNGLADIDVIVGYNFINDDCYHFGLGAMAVLPTGKKRKNLFVLDPLVGNGKHFELGGFFSAHTVLWSGEDSNLAVFLEGNVTHMFRSQQCRTFDLLNNGPFSRYLLLKEFDTNGTNFTYNNTLVSATCFTTRHVDVSLDIKGDAALKLAYRWCGLGIDVGYNIYGHSQETIELRCNACPADIDRRKFGIKGTEGVCCSNFTIARVPNGPEGAADFIFPDGTAFPAGSTAPIGCAIPLPPTSVVTNLANNGTQSTATAFKPGKAANGALVEGDCTVCLNSGTVTSPTRVDNLTPDNGFTKNNGLQPTLLSVTDIDIASGQAHSVITHKLFTHICYTWMDECGWNPQLGVGFEVEFDGNHNRSGCEQTGLNQWGVWIKGCLSF